jgi:hypothetical protein
LTTVGNSSNPNLIQESSTDYEIGYGHRFNGDNVVNVDGYFSFEKIASSAARFRSRRPFVLPPDLLSQYLARISSFCGSPAQATIANLGYLRAITLRARAIKVSN